MKNLIDGDEAYQKAIDLTLDLLASMSEAGLDTEASAAWVGLFDTIMAALYYAAPSVKAADCITESAQAKAKAALVKAALDSVNQSIH